MFSVRRTIILLFIISSSSFGIDVGKPAPPFSALNQDGKKISLSQFKNNYVLLYFYPQDDTYGCTAEAKGFQAELENYKNTNAVILGVSSQGIASHKKFASKYGLTFDLLADEDGMVRKSYDIGKVPVLGLAKRESVLIGPDGNILRIYKDVDPKKHPGEVISDIKSSKN